MSALPSLRSSHTNALRQLLHPSRLNDNTYAHIGHELYSRDALDHDASNDFFEEGQGSLKPKAASHYTCPPTAVEELRRRHGAPRSVWGEWSCAQTRQFYRQQLPVALQIDGVMGLSLEERARLAAEARHALRVYARERCCLPGRVAAMAFDGLRHLRTFGYLRWDGMTWEEIHRKYRERARALLGSAATEEEVTRLLHELIVERACATNEALDSITIARVSAIAGSLDAPGEEVAPLSGRLSPLSGRLSRRRQRSRRLQVMRKLESSVAVLLHSIV